jgi:hypothetical protein
MSNTKKWLKACGAAGTLVSAMAILFCSKDYNPFSDLTNAKVHVLSYSFLNRDSVPLYETGTFTSVVALREEVESFSFHAPKNRFWRDTTVRASADKIIDGGPYVFRVSFFDTGYDSVTVKTFRSNGEMVSQTFAVRVYNPLHQGPVSGYFGQPFNLQTAGVPDTALYHWNFGISWHTSSVVNQVQSSVSILNPRHGTGKLKVTDLAGNNPTPEVEFTYAFDDTSKPVITCENDGLHGDTITSGDTVFSFKVRIWDVGSAEVESCAVNDQAFDYSNRSTLVYTKVFNNFPELTRTGAALRLAVYALDSRTSGHASCDTFYAVFNAGGTKSEHYSINFSFPNQDTVTIAGRFAKIFGDARSDRGDTMTLYAQINGKTDPVPKTIVRGGTWDWFVGLDNLINIVVVSAYGTDNKLLTSAQRVIVVNPNTLDTIKPVIWEVSVDGTVIPNSSDRYSTEKSDALLKVVAFDVPSGVAKLIVNHDTMSVDDTTYTWPISYGNLQHSVDGNTVHIIVVDKKGNATDRTITIFKNTVPFIADTNIGIPSLCCMDSTYTARIKWRDAEEDDIGVTITSPRGMEFLHLESNQDSIVWKPVFRADTARDTLTIELRDRYFGSNRYQWIFTSFPCNRTASAIAFLTRDRDFPQVLQVGVDRLGVPLAVDTAGLSFTPRYSARFLDNSKVLLDNLPCDTLRWSPAIEDTGFRKLMVTVGNDTRSFDTLFPSFWVVPRNQYACALTWEFSGAISPLGALDLYSHPEPETLNFTIHDLDHPLTESYKVTVSQGSLRTVSVFNQKEFFIAITPDTSKAADTLKVSVLDKTGRTDSAQFIVQYSVPTGNTPPGKAVLFPDTAIYYCAGTTRYNFVISFFDQENDPVDVRVKHAPDSMHVSLRGIVDWTPPITRLGSDSLVIRLYDQHDSSGLFSWRFNVIDCAKKPPPVNFQTSATIDFPSWLQAGVDSVSLQLKTVPGTGMRPFLFNARTDKGDALLTDDSVGMLSYHPANSDTGYRTMQILVKDKYLTSDTISPQIQVVPRNGQKCHLSYTYSGTVMPSSGYLYYPASYDLYTTTPPESAKFVIEDADHPLTEQYTIRIAPKSSQATTITQPGSNRAFSVKISYNYGSGASAPTRDTIMVSVKDKTGSADSARLIIQFPIRSLSSIPQLYTEFNSSTNVNTAMGTQVRSWDEVSGSYYSISLSQSDYDRQPILKSNFVNGKPAIYFDHISDNGDDGLFTSSYGGPHGGPYGGSDVQWADTPFTLFVVFSANSIPANTRQTLVSTNTADGFGVGIACNGKLGIFNDALGNTPQGNSCPTGEWASTEFTVTKGTWYVATWQSTLGIPVSGNIRVQAWLNGAAASQAMEMQTQADPGMAFGTGAEDFGGSFDGYLTAIVIFKRALSSDERVLVEKYLGGQYKITVK